MKDFRKYILLFVMSLSIAMGGVFTSCNDDDDYDTNQIKGGVSLTAAQLQLTRGGYMVFKGSGLNQIETIIFPDNVSVSNIEVVDQYTIRCIVPEDAVVGKVQLVYGGGSKVLETDDIAFTEPTTITSLAPETVKPGDELTIKGTYLANVTHVEFNGANTEVTSASRYEVKVIVPIWAKTGSVVAGYMLSLTDSTSEFTGIVSETELTVTAPTITKVSATTIKSGESLTIEGTQLNQIQYVRFNGAEGIAIANNELYKELTSISVTVPATAIDGVVTLISYAGDEYATEAIAIKQPVVSIKDAKESYGVDDKVVLSGTDLDLVASAAFDGESESTAVSLASDGTISLTVSAAAKSGNITLTLKNGQTIAVSGFVTTKPVASDFPASATPLDKLNVTATLATRITTIKFGDLEATPEATETGFSVVVPLLAENGCKVVAIMDNGEDVVLSESFTVNSFTFCAFADAVAFESQNVTVDNLAAAKVINGGNLTNVLLNGNDTKYLLTGETLYVYVGTSVGTQTITLVSGETKVDYTVSVVASGVIETTLWTGPLEITWSDGGRVVVNWNDLANIPSGSTLRLYFNGKDGVWAQAQLNDGSWNKEFFGTLVPSDIEEYQWWNGGAAEEHYYDITLTSEVLQHLGDNHATDGDFEGAALIIQGSDLIFSKVSVIVDYSAPKTIWEGSQHINWGGEESEKSLAALAYGGFDWSSVSAGQTLYLYFTSDDDNGWYCFSLRHGDGWGNLPGNAYSQVDLGSGTVTTSYEIELTKDILDDLVANNGLIITGQNYTLTKVAIK